MAEGGDKLGSYAFELDGQSYEVDVVYQGVPGAGGQQDVGGAKSLPKLAKLIDPCVKAAALVVESARETNPDEVTVTFGLVATSKVSFGLALGTDATFEVTLKWTNCAAPDEPPAET